MERRRADAVRQLLVGRGPRIGMDGVAGKVGRHVTGIGLDDVLRRWRDVADRKRHGITDSARVCEK